MATTKLTEEQQKFWQLLLLRATSPDIGQPFLSYILFNLIPVNAPGMKTMGVDKNGRCYIDFDYLMDENNPRGGLIEATKYLNHEPWHILRNHHDRFDSYPQIDNDGIAKNSKFWNYAGDLTINQDIKEIVPAYALHVGEKDFSKYKPNLTTEAYYKQIVKDFGGNACPDCGAPLPEDKKKDEKGKDKEKPQDDVESDKSENPSDDTSEADKGSEGEPDANGDPSKGDDKSDNSQGDESQSESDGDGQSDDDGQGEGQGQGQGEGQGQGQGEGQGQGQGEGQGQGQGEGQGEGQGQGQGQGQGEGQGEGQGQGQGEGQGEGQGQGQGEGQGQGQGEGQGQGQGDGQDQGQGKSCSSCGTPQQGIDGGNCGSGAGNPNDYELDPTDNDHLSESEIDSIRRSVAEDIKRHEQSYPGTVPGNISLWADETLTAPTPDWRTILRSSLKQGISWKNGKMDYNRSRRARRSFHPDIIMPALRAPKARISVGIDKSGSNLSNLGIVVANVEEISKQAGVRGRELTAFGVDVKADKPKFVPVPSDVLKDMAGGGGTDMRVAFQVFEEQLRKKETDICILATDLETGWPSKPLDNSNARFIVLGVMNTNDRNNHYLKEAEKALEGWATLVTIFPDDIE